MKRLLAVIAGGLGLRALWRRRARSALSPSPAQDLRAKLAEQRAREEEPEPVVPEAPAASPPEDVAARRAEVHDRARRAMDELDA